MADIDSMTIGKAKVSKPDTFADSADARAWFSKYGEQRSLMSHSPKYGLADEGSYFVGSNQAPGTGIAINAVVTAFANTNGIVHGYNTDSSKRVYLDYLRLILGGTAPTATTVKHFAIAIDNGSRTPATKTDLTPRNVCGPSGEASVLTLCQYAAGGAFTVTAPTGNVRYVRCSMPTSLGIVGDEYIIKFGAPEDVPITPGLTAVRATAAARIVAYCAPVIVGPGQSFVIHRWWQTEATNAPTYELELGWYER